MAEAAAGVFHALVQAALAEAGKGLDEDESEGEADAAAASREADASSLEVSHVLTAHSQACHACLHAPHSSCRGSESSCC